MQLNPALFNNFFSQIKSFIKAQALLFGVAGFLMLFANMSFFSKLTAVYPLNANNIGLLISISLFFTLANVILLLITCHPSITRYVLAFFLVGSSLAAFYMDHYGVVIDTVMFDNVLQTDAKEIAGLLNVSLFSRLGLLGLLPAFLVLKYGHRFESNLPYRANFKLAGILLMFMLVLMLPFTAGYANFIREHKPIRMYANPTFFSYSLIKYLGSIQLTKPTVKPLEVTAKDTHNVDTHHKHELIIMVVGETARFDRFSLNGYHKLTNPLLAKEDVVSLKNVTSCGTSTGVSVPCMFSVFGRKNYDKDTALHTENALDVLARNGVEVLWRDNNSDSKGVALRVKYEDFKSPTLNPVCENECRDIGMLSGLDTFVKAHPNKDTLIVLHQMGNHGPEYYRRYPDSFKKFQPICKTGDIRNCSKEEVDNAYDNAILYTDYFLSEVIQFLKKYDTEYETAMLYVADHGESLGEHGFYLHAAPYMIAPKEQTHVPAIVWLGQHFDYNIKQLKQYQDYPLSHDDVFCTLLTAYELESNTCHAKVGWLMNNQDLHPLPNKH